MLLNPVTLALLHFVPLPTGNIKFAVPSFDIGPDTKLVAEPLVDVAVLLNANIFVVVV